ncbi:MAG: hypothetical protein R3Y43_03315 [Alphaproteobacteria bacterium]
MIKFCFLFVMSCVFSIFSLTAHAGVVSLGSGASTGYGSGAKTFVSRGDGYISTLGAITTGTHANYVPGGGDTGYYNRDNCPSPAILSNPVAGVSNSFESCSCPDDYKEVTDATKQQGLGVPCAIGEVALYPYVACRYDLTLNSQGNCGCADGYYFVNAEGCVACEAGHWCKDDIKTACSVGSYQPYSGQSECSECTAGTYQGSTAGITCGLCSAGTYSQAGAVSCITCATGKCSNSGASSCDVGNSVCPLSSPTGSTYCGGVPISYVWKEEQYNNMVCTGSASGTCYSGGELCTTGQACVSSSCKNTVCFGQVFYIN